MLLEDPSDHVFIDLNAEGMRNLLGNLEVTKSGVPSFHLHDRGYQFRGRPFGARLSSALRGIKQPVLALDQGFVKALES